MNTANELSQPESEMESCPPLLSSVISTHSTVRGTPQHIRAWLMSSQAGSPASHSASQESAKEPQTNATAGPQRSNASAWFDPNGRCWRTFQASLLADTLEPFSETWPRAGLIAAGVFYPLPKWERRIAVIGSGLWHTPNVPNGGRVNPVDMSPTGIMPNGQKRQVGLEHQVRMVERKMWPSPTVEDAGRMGSAAAWMEYEEAGKTTQWRLRNAVQMWPTPTKADGLGGPGNSGRDGGDNLRTAVAKAFPTPSASPWRSGTGSKDREGHAPMLPEVIGGQLNPTWVEWLMGWPLGWTDLQPLEMDKFRQWLEQHGC